MTYEDWNNSYGFIRSDLVNMTKAAFAAGAASRDAEIAELVEALEHARPFLHGNTHSGYAAVLVDKALATKGEKNG